MARSKIKLVISDFHLGAGPLLPDGTPNYLEDFFHDKKLVEFLEYYSTGDYAKTEVELIINGDFFNHLQVYPDEKRPELMTERVALMRTGAIMNGHPEVFTAMSRFATTPKHSVVFMIGNHDMGLLWPAVGEYLKERLDGNVRINMGPVYADSGVWIEHGNQQMAENRIDFKRPFLEENGEGYINMPWGDLFVIRYLNKVKRKRPYVDKVYPFRLYLRWALIHDTFFALKAAFMGLVYFLAVFFRIGDNKHFSRQQFMKIVKEFSFPVKMGRAAKRIFALNPSYRIVVFGHGHQAQAKLFADGREYFNTGIWNEMISLDIGTMGRKLLLSFVEIEFDSDGVPHGNLREWKGEYREIEDLGLL